MGSLKEKLTGFLFSFCACIESGDQGICCGSGVLLRPEEHTPPNLDHSKQIEVLDGLGQACLMQGEYTKASEYFLKIIEIDPWNHCAHYHLGDVYHELRDLSAAELWLQKAIQLDSSLAEPWIVLGLVYREKGEIDKAIETSLYAEAVDPENTVVLYNLGFLYQCKKNKPKALEYYSKAIEFHPDDSDAMYNVGILYQSMGKHQEAIEWYTKAIDAAPEKHQHDAQDALNKLHEHLRRKKEKEEIPGEEIPVTKAVAVQEELNQSAGEDDFYDDGPKSPRSSISSHHHIILKNG